MICAVTPSKVRVEVSIPVVARLGMCRELSYRGTYVVVVTRYYIYYYYLPSRYVEYMCDNHFDFLSLETCVCPHRWYQCIRVEAIMKSGIEVAIM